jgi:hypothetical protein
MRASTEHRFEHHATNLPAATATVRRADHEFGPTPPSLPGRTKLRARDATTSMCRPSERPGAQQQGGGTACSTARLATGRRATTVNGVYEMTVKTLATAAAVLLLAAGAANAQSTVSPSNNNNWQLPAAGAGGASADKTVSPSNNNWQLPAAGAGGASADKKQNAPTTQKPN